jgi:hypothetical protein
MDWVLDLDLDFFVWPVKRDRPVRKRLPRNSWTHLATPSDVRSFLEKLADVSSLSIRRRLRRGVNGLVHRSYHDRSG